MYKLRSLIFMFFLALASYCYGQNMYFAYEDAPEDVNTYLVISYEPSGNDVISNLGYSTITGMSYTNVLPSDLLIGVCGGFVNASEDVAYYPATDLTIYCRSNALGTEEGLWAEANIRSSLDSFGLGTQEERLAAIDALPPIPSNQSGIVVDTIVQVPNIKRVFLWIVIGLSVAMSLWIVRAGWFILYDLVIEPWIVTRD